MSVTFAPVASESPVYSGSCDTCGVTVSGTFFEVFEVKDAHYNTCDDILAVEETYSDARMGVQINLSNRNAKEVLDLLGLPSNEEDGLFGTLSAEDFMGRVLLAQGVNQRDGFLPALQEGNVYHGGRPEGYFQDVLANLYEIAQAAQGLGTEVSYG